MGMKLAVLADIHGNLPALEAVVEDIQRVRPDYVVVAGDLINAVPFSVEVVELIMATDWLVVRGNHEFYYLDFGTDRMHPDVSDPSRWNALHMLHAALPDHIGNYLATLPDDLNLMWPRFEPLRVVHGMPGDPRAGVFTTASDADVAQLLEAVPQHTVITAHTHIQGERWIARESHVPSPVSPNPPFRPRELRAEQWHVINPGSVGLPLNGSVDAHYTILHGVAGAPESEGWQVDFRTVPYDRERALHAFHDRNDLAEGGSIAELFYWEVVTGLPEVTTFFRWAREHGLDTDLHLSRTFSQYKRTTRSDERVEAQDPSRRYKAGQFRASD